MTVIRKLEIQIDQTGTAKKGIKGLVGSIGGITKLGLAGGAAAAGGLALLAGATLKVGSGLIGLGSDAAEMESKFNVVFGTSAPGAAKELDEFGNAVGRSKFELMEMASTVQDTFVPLGFARDEASKLSIGLTQLAVDMGSFNNVADDQVMLDLQSAIVGNHETMRKYGVVITQATLDQELLKMGIEGGTKAATEQEKVQARLNLIYAGTSDAQGDAMETAGGWANQMRALKSTISEGATAMGSELLPVILPLLQNFTEWVKDLMPKAIEIFKEFAGDLKETLGPALMLINDAVRRIAEAFGINTEEVSSADVVLMAFKATLDVVVIAIQAVAIVMQALAAAVEWISQAVKDASKAWRKFKRDIENAVNAMPDWMIPGSPTPFELGLRGIADAQRSLPGFGGLYGGGGMAAAPVSITVNINQNGISLGNRREAETVLAPIIVNALRKELRGRGLAI